MHAEYVYVYVAIVLLKLDIKVLSIWATDNLH
jgi:hypothetical protein